MRPHDQLCKIAALLIFNLTRTPLALDRHVCALRGSYNILRMSGGKVTSLSISAWNGLVQNHIGLGFASIDATILHLFSSEIVNNYLTSSYDWLAILFGLCDFALHALCRILLKHGSSAPFETAMIVLQADISDMDNTTRVIVITGNGLGNPVGEPTDNEHGRRRPDMCYCQL
jgi:preprotein translocase subunit SecG